MPPDKYIFTCIISARAAPVAERSFAWMRLRSRLRPPSTLRIDQPSAVHLAQRHGGQDRYAQPLPHEVLHGLHRARPVGHLRLEAGAAARLHHLDRDVERLRGEEERFVRQFRQGHGARAPPADARGGPPPSVPRRSGRWYPAWWGTRTPSPRRSRCCPPRPSERGRRRRLRPTPRSPEGSWTGTRPAAWGQRRWPPTGCSPCARRRSPRPCAP